MLDNTILKLLLVRMLPLSKLHSLLNTTQLYFFYAFHALRLSFDSNMYELIVLVDLWFLM